MFDAIFGPKFVSTLVRQNVERSGHGTTPTSTPLLETKAHTSSPLREIDKPDFDTGGWEYQAVYRSSDTI